MRRRRLVWAGSALLVSGLALLGYVLWQYLGTTWVAQREHAAVVERLDRAWADDEAAVATAGSEATAVVRVPALGGSFAVPLLEGTDEAQLAAGFGHVEGSAAPGERGNFVVAGHRVTHGEPLRRMPELRRGDEVVVETADEVLTYVLDTGGADLTVDFAEDWVLDRRPVDPAGRGVAPDPGSDRLITLVTCASLFETQDRLVAFGHLVHREPRAG